MAVAIPAFNEAEGIADFLREIDRALHNHASKVHLLVVDDASTDATREVVEALSHELSGSIEVVSNASNRGHGPSLIEAYRRTLDLNPDFVLQVDGDGQFHGSDLRRVLVLLIDDAHAVSGVRRFRQDPWFRMIMTGLVRRYIAWGFHVNARDPNCPLRGYRAQLLNELIELLPPDSLVPNLYLTVLASRRGEALLEVDVSHRVRRGAAAQGTMFRGGGYSPIPWRLVRFSLQALRESLAFRTQLDTPVWARRS